MNGLGPLFILAAFVLAIALVVWRRTRKAVPRIEDFPHYVTEPCDGLPLTGWLSITLDVVGPFPADATLTPFFQREGDDWSARGKMEAYRWWASFATIPLVPGPVRLDVPFAANWTAVLQSSRDTNPQAYADALRNAARVGFTIGNVTGLGHGSNPPGALRGVRIGVAQ